MENRDADRFWRGFKHCQGKVVFVGEQPGDREDLAGRPFVGPAGMLLDRALEQAGIDRNQVYVTNVVKHFKWVRDERGKRRIHKKPNPSEIKACRPWLDAELAVIKPQILVCLRGHRSPGIAGKKFQREPSKRTVGSVDTGSLLNGYCAPLLATAYARGEGPARRDGAICRRLKKSCASHSLNGKSRLINCRCTLLRI
jgi:uracil-DNA glycosylase family 4